MSKSTTHAAAVVTFVTVKAANPDLFALSIVDAVASTYDKDSARATIARAITGAALEWAMSGNDARLKSARAALEGKGKGQAVRKLAVAAIDSVKGANKARHLAGSGMPAIDAWIGEALSTITVVLTPAPAAPKAPKNAPSAPIVSAPALTSTGEDGAASDLPDASTAPWTDNLTADTVIAHIAAGAFTIMEMMAISKALGKATMAMPATAEAEAVAVAADNAAAEAEAVAEAAAAAEAEAVAADNAAAAAEAEAIAPAAPVVAAPALFEGMEGEAAPIAGAADQPIDTTIKAFYAAVGAADAAGKGVAAGAGKRGAKTRKNAVAAG
jgi:hypothetical protein